MSDNRHDEGMAIADAMARADIKASAEANLPLRCTVCGKKCEGPGCRYSRHGYGVISEPRCSTKCSEEPFVNTDLLRAVVGMGEIVLRYRTLTGQWGRL